jgi:hypothetical protein
MTNVERLSTRRAESLSQRRTVTIDLPEFAIRALEYRAEVANAGPSEDEEHVTSEDVIEWHVISPLSVKEMPHLEQAVPGFTAAFAEWLLDVTYAPPE